MSKISIIFLTNRKDPKFEWFVESLYHQTTAQERKDIELIFIDALADTMHENGEISRADMLYNLIAERFTYKHSLPKPNIYQGKDRKTKTEMFAASNARNTGILLSSGSYLVFADDVAVLMPSWWEAVKDGFKNNRIICGAYQKHFEMLVEDGKLISSRFHQGGNDSRWNIGSDQGPVNISGQSLFGCSLAIPAKDILDVNGFDELCDSIGGEDYHLGIRLNNNGKRIFYDRRMLTIESEELHNPDINPKLMLRDDRVLDNDAYNARLREFGVGYRKAPGRCDSSHMILDILLGSHQIKTLGNNYNIAVDRESHYFFPPADVQTHWFDSKPLAEI